MSSSMWRGACASGIAACTIALGIACSDDAPSTGTKVPPADAASDAHSGHDAAGDAGEAVEPFCATRPQLPFCEDFDAPGFVLPGKFASKDDVVAALAIDEQASTSPPRSLLGSAPGSATHAVLRTPAQGPGRKFRLFAQVRVDGRPSGGAANTEILALEFSAGYRLGVTTDGTGAWKAFQEGKADAAAGDVETFVGGASTSNVPDGDWTSIRFEVDFDDAGGGRMTVKLGDVVAVERVPLAPPVSSSQATGVVGLRATDAWRVRYDNVTFSVE